jgi:hypothetical protein
MDENLTYFLVERLHEFSTRVFVHFGVPVTDARQAANVLAASDLRGVDTHDVARLHAYFDMLALGHINPRANVRVVRELPATATVERPLRQTHEFHPQRAVLWTSLGRWSTDSGQCSGQGDQDARRIQDAT